MASERGGSASRPSGARRWIAQVPVWVRIAIGALLLGIAVLLVTGLVSLLRPAPSTAEAVQVLCRSAAEARLERRGDTSIAVSQSMEVTRVSDGEYRVQGTATYRGDDQAHTTDLRCTVRREDGRWRVTGVRFND